MEVYADGLDDVLRSTRETVLESEGVGLLREYILAKFNEARTWYEDWRSAEDKKTSISSRVGNTPQSLSRLPLISALRGIIDGSVQDLFLIRPPAVSRPLRQSINLRHADYAAQVETVAGSARLSSAADASLDLVAVNYPHDFSQILYPIRGPS
jgi:hypothetical protein